MPAPNDRSAADYLPARLSLATLREAVQGCRGCDLYQRATQAVFGEGLKRSAVMIVGEQPGDQEDVQGHPFVGPAGPLLDGALGDAGIDRSTVYVTNAVKHFKWKARGKRRIHERPDAGELAACFPWLEAEIRVVKPEVLVAVGATAAKTLYGKTFKVTRRRGEVFASEWAKQSTATVHPSSILRAPDDESRRSAYRTFVADLVIVAEMT